VTDGPTQLILFDGVCNLCNTTVQRIIARDPNRRFRFGTLQSDAARRALEEASASMDLDDLPDSIVLLDSEGVHTRSTAAIRIARQLGFPYVLLGLGVVLPRRVRDSLYQMVARNRYRWFGRQDQCMVPTSELAARFIDGDD